jgi:outer membrane protein insertion porin family
MAASVGTAAGAMLRVVAVEVASARRPSGTLAHLLQLRPGDPYSADLADSDLKRLYATGAFDDVRLTVSPVVGGVSLVYRCVDRTFVSSLRFTDHLFPIQVARNAVGMAAGEPLDRSRLAEAPGRLHAFYQRAGYPDARVEVKLAEQPEHKAVDIVFHVQRGPAQRVLGRKFTGDVPVAQWRLRRQLELRFFDRLRPDTLDQERRRILEYLRRHGFIGASVGEPQIQAKDDSHWVNLIIPVQAGVRTRFKVRGNRALSDDEILEACELGRRSDLEKATRQEMAAGVVAAYRDLGYDGATAKISAPRPARHEGEQEVMVHVHQGRRRAVTAVHVEIDGDVDPDAVREVMALAQPRFFGRPPWFRQDLFEADRQAILTMLRERGYYAPDVYRYEVTPVNDGVAVEVGVRVDGRSLLVAVDLDGVTLFSRDDLLAGFATDVPLRLEEVDALRERIVTAYRHRGYLAAQVQTHLVPLGGGRWRLQVAVDEGQEVRIGGTQIRGLERTHPRVVKRELRYAPGDPLDPERLAASRQALSRLGLFERIDLRPDPLLTGAPVQDVVVDVDEGPAGEVAAAIGFGSQENLRTSLEISHRNPLGYNRPIAFLTQLSSLERTFSVSGREPYLFNTHTSLLLNLVDTTREFENFTKKTIGTAAILERKLSEHLDGSLGFQYDNASLSNITGDVVVTDAETGRIGISSFIGSLLWDFRDNPPDPTRGVLFGTDVQLATDVLLSERNFLKIGGQFSGLLTPWSEWTTAVGLRLGTIMPTVAGEEEPIQVRYFLGGRSTIRAFRQDELTGDDPNQLGGTSFLLFNLEERFPLYHRLRGVVFTDIGNVFTSNNPFVHLGDVRYTAGVGLRVTTPVGPLRLDYGRKLNRKRDESAGELHFTLGHAF